MGIPTISVIMSCYNSERYLRESIDSILSQTYTDFEFIIWNDGSTDSTESIIKSYNDPRIVYISAPNQGLGKALHDACEKARGKYIARMDDDDIALPNRLQVEYDYMESHPNCILASCAVKYIDEGGNIIGCSGPALTDMVLKKTFSFVHPGAIFRTDVYRKTHGYYNLRTAQDKVLWQIMAPYGKFQNINKILLKYRVQSNSIGRKQRIGELSECCLQIRNRLVNEGREGVYNQALIDLHNQIYKLNTELSKIIPPVQDQRNGSFTKIYNLLHRFSCEEWSSKILSWIATVYHSIR